MSRQTKSKEPADRVIDTTLELIAERGWRAVDIAGVLEASETTQDAFHIRFDDLYSVLEAAVRRTMSEMLAAESDFELEDSIRDRLFALIMAGFDAATPWRKAIGALLRAAPFDPLLSATATRSCQRAATLALDTAQGTKPRGRGLSLRAAVLVPSVMLPAGRAWLRDDTADLSKTMAALDRALGRAERLARLAGPLARGRRVAGRTGDMPQESDSSAIPAPDPHPTAAQQDTAVQQAGPRKTGARTKSGGTSG